MRPLLLCRVGDDEGLARLVGEAPLLVGRAKDCDFPLVDPQSSRRHLRVSFHAGLLRAEDLESARGTLLNGRPLAPNDPVELRHLDVLQVADTELVVADLDAAPRGSVVAACIIGPGDFRVPLRRGSNVIGASSDCDLVVDDPEVAAKHADLVLTESECRLVRLQSAGPLAVNGEEVVHEMELASGDVFQLSPRATFGVEVHLGTGLTPVTAPVDPPVKVARATDPDPDPEPDPEPEPEPPEIAALGTLAEDEGERTHAVPVAASALSPEADGDRTHAAAPEPPPQHGTAESEEKPPSADTATTSTLRLDEIRSAVESARARHAAEMSKIGGHDTTGGRSKRTPIPISTGGPPAVRMPSPPPDFRAARREAAVRIHVQLPGSEPVVVLLREGAHRVGSSERCRVRISHPSLTIEHAEIHVGPQGIRVRALTPEGLVLRDGRRLADAPVAVGERIRFGDLEAWFEEL